MTATLNDEVADLRRANAELQRRLDERTAERDEALEQQTATAEVLQVINSSPGDLGPVFDAILDKALRLCDAHFGQLITFDGVGFRAAAWQGYQPEPVRSVVTTPPTPGMALFRLVHGEAVVHVPDITADEVYRSGNPTRRRLADEFGGRTAIWMALKKDAVLLGAFVIYRREIRPFTDKQIALLENFAAQAVIAMENARLINETREALEQQTATAEVLGVINSSPGDLQPVFDAMLEKAMRLCEAAFGVVHTYDGDALHPVAMRGLPPRFAEFASNPANQPGRGGATPRLMRGEPIVHVVDLKEEEAYRSADPYRRALVDIGGARTLLAVPLRKDGKFLGQIAVYRQEVRPYTEKQVALLENFAAQAVIAMENARLLGELRERTDDLQESLEYQTATSDVLQVISRSTFDLNTIFETVVGSAIRLCRADNAGIYLNEGGEYRRAVGVAVKSPDYDSIEANARILPGPGTVVGRAALEQRTVQIEDAWTDPLYEAKVDARIGGVHTMLGVPLLREGAPIGVLALARERTQSFSEAEIQLVTTFADQAVIAIENARLITETREALEQQTATAEVLGVINSSPGDLVPVFEAMLEKAMYLCEAAFGSLAIYDREQFQTVAVRGVPDAYAEFRRQNPPDFGPGTMPARLLAGERVIHTADLMDEDAYWDGEPNRRAIVDLGGARTALLVGLNKENAILGFMMIYRKEMRPFSDRQVAILQNFAAQAVIAMENARLLGELRERTSDLEETLEYQTATSDVLKVISRSTFDLSPVLEYVVETAIRLCRAHMGSIFRLEDGVYRWAVGYGLDPAYREIEERTPIIPGAGTLVGRVALEGHTLQIADALSDPIYAVKDDARLTRARTMLGVPLLREGAPVGVIAMARDRVEPFSDKEIALVTTFADQAVIAIENARLLNEIRQRQAELRVTFDNMADGVAMFDEDLRLAAWNRNFQQIADLPEVFLSERPSYTDYLHILTERGELDALSSDAEFSRRLEHTDQELRLERTRPNGQVIEVRRNAVPDGGFVLIYSDITERKRSEAEISAARDAAEATLRDLRAAQANLIQAEKMASLGQLTAGIAHEIKNPLNFVNNFADLSGELLKELKEAAAPGWAELDQDKRAEIDETVGMLSGNLEKIAEHGRRADNIVKSMLEHSRGVTSERRKADLNNLVEEALNLAYHGARAQDQTFNITLERDYDRDLAQIELVPQEMSRVFINLIGNGFYAAVKRQRENGGSDFHPTLTVATRDLGEVVEVRVRDNGIGIPADIKDKLFQPFFTTKPTGEGTGLGLSISYDIVTQQHGGTIAVESEPGAFTEFTVRLPRTYRATAGEAA
jgi:GAF domain-containing protein/two-component sensor histidine kinase